ncbi:hypothetical protein ACJ72_06796, partial [Emergomyces africanus]
ALEREDGKGKFVVERREEEGGQIVYEDIEEVKRDYRNDTLTPQLLKAAVTTALNKLLAPVQAAFQANPEWQEIEKKAYPPPPEPEKKKKKPKDKGSRYPGGGAAPKVDGDGTVTGSVEEKLEKLEV